ncbi:MAG: hypothetical protein ACNA7V_03105 [Bacteroidales bacterium]
MYTLLLIGLIFFAGGNLKHISSGKVSIPDYPDDVVWIEYKPPHLHKITGISFLPPADYESLAFPIKRAGNLILLEAVIDDISGNLILDTGSSGMVLNSIYFRQGRKTGGLVAGGITGSTGPLTRTKIRSLQISEMFFEDITADVLDLGHIENARNVKVLGFFGLSLIAGYEVVIDLRNSILELHPLDQSGHRTSGSNKSPSMDLNIPVRSSNGVVFLDALMSEMKLTFCLDTGAEANVLSSQLPGRVLNTVSIFRRSNLRGAGTHSVEVLYGVMHDFSIDDVSLPGMNTIVTNLSAMSRAFAVRIDGMLGCDFLEKGIFYINLKQNTLGISLYKEELK